MLFAFYHNYTKRAHVLEKPFHPPAATDLFTVPRRFQGLSHILTSFPAYLQSFQFMLLSQKKKYF